MKIEVKEATDAGKKPLGLYLHIPFCQKKCFYCDFLSAAGSAAQIERYVEALCRQLEREAAQARGYRVKTIFLGGGTPSLLSVEQAERILQAVDNGYVLDKSAEITMESNPGTLTLKNLEGYRRIGINRLSMGLQSTLDIELERLGRIHTWQVFCENFRAARQAGFSNINVDMMFALPGQEVTHWQDSLRKVAEMAPEHLSAYSLSIEEGTPFYERYGEERKPRFFSGSLWPPLPTEEQERQMYRATSAILREYGYHRYEISNYAKPGMECRHNLGYWQRQDYWGFGLGSASLVNNTRFQATSQLQKYLDCLEGRIQDSLYEERKPLSRTEQMEEFMFLGLRLDEGISLAQFRRQFGVGLLEIYPGLPQKLEKQGLLLFYQDGKKMKLTERGIDISNYVLAQFLLEEDEDSL